MREKAIKRLSSYKRTYLYACEKYFYRRKKRNEEEKCSVFFRYSPGDDAC